MKRIVSLFLALIIFVLCSPAFAAYGPSRWAVQEVNSAIKEGIVPQDLQTDYRNAITRKEFCEIVVLVYDKLGGSDATYLSTPFSDVDNEAVTKASALGIVIGTGGGMFSPDNNITRQEICALLTRTVQAAMPEVNIPKNLPNTFPDIDLISDWAVEYVKYINIIEVMLGDEENRINPHNNTTREQAILLSLRLFSAFTQSTYNFLSSMGFKMSGNSSVNMLNGTFAITHTNGPLYLSDKTGVYAIDSIGARSYITYDEASEIFMLENEKYYIKKSDGLLYGLNGTPICKMRASKFVPVGNYIYFISPDASGIYRVPTEGGNAVLLIEGNTTMPVSSGKYIYYTTQDGIYKYDIIEESVQKIYDGTVSAFSITNSRLYFKDADGFLVTASNDGSNAVRITKEPIDKYCNYGFDAFVYTKSDGVYKTNLSSKFTIRISDGTFDRINTYNNYIFLKDFDGNIYRMSSNATDLAKLN